MIDDIIRDHCKVHNIGTDENGHAIVSMSFVDMVALTKRVKDWCERVIALMEASGAPGLSISPDAALPLFLTGTSPEDAAAQLVVQSETMPADPVRSR